MALKSFAVADFSALSLKSLPVQRLRDQPVFFYFDENKNIIHTQLITSITDLKEIN